MILGDLVTSTQFSGVGKIIDVINQEICKVAFFHSPQQPHSNIQEFKINELKKYHLYSEQVVYILAKDGYWQRARYIGEYTHHQHLLVIRENEKAIVNLADIFVLNTQEEWVNPVSFLSVQANDAPFFYYLREKFIEAYINQRASCCSIGAILSSSIELEAHQLAVVKRVIQDPVQKYLLADEVGLGKTIETGVLIRNHVLNLQKNAYVLVIVPDNLVHQWHTELSRRFHLEDVMSSEDNSHPNIEILGYQDFCQWKAKDNGHQTMIVVDEMHHIAAWAWGNQLNQQLAYHRLVHLCEQAQSVLLLSGTPLNGNEKNFLSILHCLSPQHYQLDEKGIQNFKQAIEQSEWLGGIRGALVAENNNTNIEGILDELNAHFLEDQQLHQLIAELKPLVDFLDGRDEDDEERNQLIEKLNQYIGEHYRLYERMLRNRRDNKGLRVLFPGLAGAFKYQWSIAAGKLSLEYLLLEYLAERYPEDEQQYFAWFKDFMISPQMIIQRCEHALNDATAFEQQSLQEIITQATIEQKAKDQLLVEMIYQALQKSIALKIIVFIDDHELSKQVYQLLLEKFGDVVEHNATLETLKFNEDNQDVRVLVCDAKGEDGLNLQGKERLVIHYAMTHSISRLEQRLGRVNRYSASVKGILPIESWLLLPEYQGIFQSWVNVLVDAVGIFNRTIASLQYVLEEQFALTWRDSLKQGIQAFERLQNKLGDYRDSNPNSFIEVELKKVRSQEELMNMDDQVKLAEIFAKRISQSDETAEQDAKALLDWMTQGLRFEKHNLNSQQFRLDFKRETEKNDGRTLLDIQSFLENCLMGMDYTEGLKTHVMSPSRRFLSLEGSNVYPLRYGQPFVDSIFNLLKKDGRGASSALLRVFKRHKLPEPQIFFQTSWLVQHRANNPVVADELFTPRIEKIWLNFKGNEILETHPLYKFLFVPYEDQRLKNLLDETNLRPEIWSVLKKSLSLTQWEDWVKDTTTQAQAILTERYKDQALQFILVSVHAQIYLSSD